MPQRGSALPTWRGLVRLLLRPGAPHAPRSCAVPLGLDVSDGLLTAVPAGQLVTAGKPTQLPGIVVSDPDAVPSDTVTVVLSTKSGLLSAAVAGGATVAGSGTTGLTVTGSLAAVNSTLANLTYYDKDPGAHTSDTIDLSTSDSEGR